MQLLYITVYTGLISSFNAMSTFEGYLMPKSYF